MKILLLSPRQDINEQSTPNWLRIPQLSLSILSALTPERHEVVMHEEEDGGDLPEGPWDLVGITSMTANAHRAYQLAREYRKNGALVVLGGIHPSVMPAEAGLHADSVVIGEAEGIWELVLDDAEKNRLRKYYRNNRPDIANSPLPHRKKRRSIFGLPPYIMPIMYSRGCPNDCEFCCVHTVFGRRQRFIPVEKIIEDIRANGVRTLIFLDDNIGGRRSYSLKLFAELKKLNVRWFCQGSCKTILDDELFNAMVDAGCKGIFVGLETVEPKAMKSIRKSLGSPKDYAAAIKRCRKAGVIFHASLIFGLDEQGPDVFKHTLDFLNENSVPSISPNILTPYPGTRLFDRLLDEGRILHSNWTYYDHTSVSFKPRNFGHEELTEKYLDFREKFFSIGSIMGRFPAQIGVHPLVYLGMNISFRSTSRKLRYRMDKYLKWVSSENKRALRREDLVFETPEQVRTEESALVGALEV